MRIGISKSLITGCVVLAFGIGLGAQAQTMLPCDPSAEVRLALQNVPSDADRAARIAAYRKLLDRFPDDLFVHQRYQDTARHPSAKQRDAVVSEYRTLAEQHPDSSLFAYLTARIQIGVSTKQVLPQLEKLTASVPAAYLDLVSIYQAPNFKDPKKAMENLQAFMKTCPASVRGFSYMRNLEPSDFLRQSTDRLRRLLAESNDPDSLANFGTLDTE